MGNRVADEFAGVALGDERLNDRARTTAEALAFEPAAGAPKVLTSSELEGFYRFVNNERVSLPALLASHAAATVVRTEGQKRVVVAHDTTDFRFEDEVLRDGLGPMPTTGQGFFAHFSLAVGGLRDALGVVAVEPWTRTTRIARKRTSKERYEDPAKEPLRWMRGVREAERIFHGGARVIHVMDREADDYDILTDLVSNGYAFVVRGSCDRRLHATDVRLKTFARQLEVRCERPAQLTARGTRRSPKQRKLHPVRDARFATLTFAARTVTLRRPDSSRSKLATLTLNVVHVHEPQPPEGCEAIEWFLLTSEPVETDEQIFQVVDDYRGRWVIGASSKGRITQSVEVRPRPKDSRSRSVGGTVARNQDGEALRQSLERRFAKLQVAA